MEHKALTNPDQQLGLTISSSTTTGLLMEGALLPLPTALPYVSVYMEFIKCNI